MRPIIMLGILLMAVSACKDKAPASNANTKNATSEAKLANNNALSSLTKEQQDAVRLLVRDTLVSNPNILLEAQQAYEAQQSRQMNEAVAKSFTRIKTEEAQIAFGPPNAKVIIVEYFDYKCGFCHAANPWLNNLMDNNHDIRVIFKELPILSENSTIAAKAAMAAHKQGKYLQFHRALMQASGDLNIDQIIQIATTVGLDTNKLRTDMNDPQITQRLEKIRSQATELGISGTPGFVINGRLISGFDHEQLEAMIAEART